MEGSLNAVISRATVELTIYLSVKLSIITNTECIHCLQAYWLYSWMYRFMAMIIKKWIEYKGEKEKKSASIQ